MPYLNLILAACAVVASHILLAAPGVREGMIRRMGLRPFQVAYSLVSLLILIWLGLAYGSAPYRFVWMPNAVLHVVPAAVMPFALLLLVTGFAAIRNLPNLEQGSDQQVTVTGVIRVMRHPILWAVMLWSCAHMLAKGDVASLIFFGAFLSLSVVGLFTLDAKTRRRLGNRWEAYRAITSQLPFLAILQGRNQLVWSEIGWRRVVIAGVLYGGIVMTHPWLFGVKPY